MNKLNIFISSTCYDLSQLRSDLSTFFIDCGHNPILSEYNNFPINPQKQATDSCIEAVNKDADLLILVVGNRYGSIIESGKSITNTEYLTAKNKGIPIYIFIDKATLNSFYFWKENKNGDFSKFVDNTKIFNFIEDIRDNAKHWTTEFDKAQDIIMSMKFQLSYLFKEALHIKQKAEVLNAKYNLEEFSASAINILLKKDSLYELEFFSQTLNDEIKKKEKIKTDFNYRIYLEPKEFIYDIGDINNWARTRFEIIRNLLSALRDIINNALVDFMNEKGKPSDIKGIFYVSSTYAIIFERIIQWTIDTSNTIVPEGCEDLKEKLALISGNAINEAWEFPKLVRKEIEDVKNELKQTGTIKKIELTLAITVHETDINNYNIAFEEIMSKYYGQD